MSFTLSSKRRIWVGKSGSKRPLGRLRCRWDHNINTYFTENAGEVDWIYLAQDRVQWRALVNMIMNLRIP
jgi:hypothetical protein